MMTRSRYSFAVILWEILTRRRPYTGYPAAAAVRAVGPMIGECQGAGRVPSGQLAARATLPSVH
jgi:hypothetical protein|eukprot:COSAG01_NODE_570_length_15328_cov_82.520783_20_plen_64_part_00